MVSTACGYIGCSLSSAREGERPCHSCLVQLRAHIRQASFQSLFSYTVFSVFVCQFVGVFFLKGHESFECQLNFSFLFIYFQSFKAPTINKPTLCSSVKVDRENSKNKYHM